MKREISRILGVLAALVCFAHAARAQLQGGADWDIDGQRFGSRSGGGSAVPSAARDANLEQLNKILSVSQLTPTDRSAYLSLRAFALARAGREASLSEAQLWEHLSPSVFQTPYSEISRILREMAPPPGSRVVDLGAGYGRMAFVVEAFFPQVEFVRSEEHTS